MNSNHSTNASGGFGPIPPADFQHLEFWTYMIEMRAKDHIPMWLQWVLVILFGIIFVFGAVGNTLSFLTMTCTSMKKHSYSVYLLFLAVSDMGCLSGSVMIWVNRVALVAGKPLPIIFTERWGCKVSEYFLHSCLTYSAWLVCALSLERAIVVSLPFAARFIASRKTATIISLATFVIVWGSTIYLMLYIEFWSGDGCYLATAVPLPDHYNTATVMACYIPISGVILFNLIIVVVLKRSKMSAKNASSTKVTNMLLTVTTTFILVNIPIAIVTIMLGLASIDEIPQLSKFHHAAVCIMMINYAVNFYLYLIGAEFRKCVRELCTRK
ncbi:succinate receptor 1-like [Tubulanus polymorphus]|uniref:succinate receptor 1-like n=1 Tax=Tubulanus polymorphus TaxID=672921 RepID=UPI003DA3F172